MPTTLRGTTTPKDGDSRSGYVEVGDHFNPEVGFLRRKGFRNVDSGFSYIYRPESFLKLQQIRPHATYNAFWNFDGLQESSFLHLDNDLEFNDSSLVKTAWNVTGEGVTTPFEIAPGVTVPVGTYDHNEAQLSYDSNGGAPVSVGMRLTAGGFFGGHRASWGPSLNMRSGDTFNASLQWSRNDVDLPGGSFVTNLTSVQVAVNFSPRQFFQALIQYNDSADLAYSRSLSRDVPEQDIFLLAIDGSSEAVVVQHSADDEVVAWSPGSKHLLFRSERSGQPGLWAQRIQDAKAVGEPQLLLNVDVAPSLGVTRDGTLHYTVRVSRRRMKIAELDMKTGRLLSQPVNVTDRFVGGNTGGVFSPDGETLGYTQSQGKRRASSSYGYRGPHAGPSAI